jgi:hypothetical protein
MTPSGRHWTAEIVLGDGERITMGIRAEGGWVIFASTRFWFKAAPDVADAISPSVQAASNAARQQQRT